MFDEQLARKLCVEPIHLLEPTEFRSSTRVGSSNWEPVSGTPGFANTLKCHELVVFTGKYVDFMRFLKVKNSSFTGFCLTRTVKERDHKSKKYIIWFVIIFALCWLFAKTVW